MMLNKLSKIRVEKGMSFRQFSAFLDIAESQYRRYEADVAPSLQVALRISKKLDMSVNDIWDSSDDECN